MHAKSLLLRQSSLSSPIEQLRVLSGSETLKRLPTFGAKLEEAGLAPLNTSGISILQVNVGKMCNQRCRHCHVDAGPERTEIMARETMQSCLDFIDAATAQGVPPTVDITGGAPEMNPDFRWFVQELFERGCKILVRSNLTIIIANKSYHDLPEFFRTNGVTVVSSLPHYDQKFTDRQRGDGVFEASIEALQRLNAVGYGMEASGLELNLVHNPSGAFFPGAQEQLEIDYKRELLMRFQVHFNKLYTITNLPISRFLEFLLESGNLEEYMTRLVQAFNPTAAKNVMCRNTVSVGWDGALFDCDFNQMLELPLRAKHPHISTASVAELANRKIVVNQHCYGCTAGAGSSCSGALT